MSIEQPYPELGEAPPEYPDWVVRPSVITIEGELATGKDAVCEILCRNYGYRYLEVSGIARGLTVAFLEERLPRDDEAAIRRFYRDAEVRLDTGGGEVRTIVNGADVTDRLRDPDTYETSSYLMRYPIVPESVVRASQTFARDGNIVMNGRLLGREVWPGAELQLFLIADFRTRLGRRFRQLQGENPDISKGAVERTMREREGREAAAGSSIASSWAIIVDTTELSIPRTAITAVEAHNERMTRLTRARRSRK